MFWVGVQIALIDSWNALEQFMQTGGVLLWPIAALMLFTWIILLERCWCYSYQLPQVIAQQQTQWRSRKPNRQRMTYMIRQSLFSQLNQMIDQRMALIKTCISLCPALGLLGTVTGMIDVFYTLSVTQGSDPKMMSAGVSKATIPTMAGMVAALSCIFGQAYVQNQARTLKHSLEDCFPLKVGSIDTGESSCVEKS